VLGDISPMGWCRLFSREIRALIADVPFVAGGGGPVPALSLDFMTPGALSPLITFTRASTGTYFDSAGVMQTAAVNAPRWDYDPVTLALRGLLLEDQRTNGIRNSTMVGAVAGSPGTAPTNWVMVTVANVVITIIGTGTENGVPYIDFSLVGTPTANSAIQINTEGTTAIAATNGQTWTSSFYCSLLSGSWTNAPLATSIAQRAAGGSAINDLVSGPFVPTTGRMQRFSFTTTTNNASTAFVLPKSVYILTTASQPINVTLRIGAPQLELGDFATSYIPTSTGAVTRSIDSCLIPPANMAPWFVAPGGSWFAEFDYADATPANSRIIGRPDTAGGVSPLLLNATRNVAQNDGATLATANATTVGVITKACSTWAAGSARICANGGAVALSASLATGYGAFTAAGIRFLSVGAALSADNTSGHIRAVRYWSSVLTDTEMQTVTTL
jgi:hypothetical protein